MKATLDKIKAKQSFVIGIAFVLFVLGIPNINSGLDLLQFLESGQVEHSVVWRSIHTTTGFGFALTGIAIVLLFKSRTIGNFIHPKNKNWILGCVAALLLLLPWFRGFDIGINNEVMVDGITVSTSIVMTTTLIFSLITWGLFSWASKCFRRSGILLGMISGASLVIPFVGILGPMAAVIVGIVAGFVAFMLQKRMTEPENNRPLWIAAVTLLAGYLALGILVLASQSPHIWDTGHGIGSWTGTAEGIEESGFENIFGREIKFAYFLAIIPSLIITGMISKENEK